MQFQIGDFVEPIYCPGAHRMVVDLNPGDPFTTPHPSIVIGWRDHAGKYHEGCIEARYARLVFRAGDKALR